MLTRLTRIRNRAPRALHITTVSTCVLLAVAARAHALPNTVQVQITALRPSTASLAAITLPTADADASALLSQLVKNGSAVRRSALVTVTDRTPLTIDDPATTPSPGKRAAAGFAVEPMTVLMPRFNTDGSVTLNISLADISGSSAQQISAVRTFHADSTQLLQAAGVGSVARSGRTLVFVTVHWPAAVRISSTSAP